jgi:LysM repeat protein
MHFDLDSLSDSLSDDIPPDPSLYHVQPNDTLNSISLHFNLPVVLLRHFNSLPSESIFPGDILRIPAGPPAPVVADSPTVRADQKKTVRVRKRVIQPLSDVELIGGKSTILDLQSVREIRKHVPTRFRMRNWKLAFQLSQHGCSFQTFYKNIERQWPLVIGIRTDSNERIGCFVSTELKISRGYLGTPDCFVFRIWENVEVFGTRGGRNCFFVTGGKNELGVGSGGKGAAIWVGGNMQSGASHFEIELKSF